MTEKRDCLFCHRPIPAIPGKPGPKPKYHGPCRAQVRYGRRTELYRRRHGVDVSKRVCSYCLEPIDVSEHPNRQTHPDCKRKAHAIACRERARRKAGLKLKDVKNCKGCSLPLGLDQHSRCEFHPECYTVSRHWRMHVTRHGHPERPQHRCHGCGEPMVLRRGNKAWHAGCQAVKRAWSKRIEAAQRRERYRMLREAGAGPSVARFGCQSRLMHEVTNEVMKETG